MNQSILARGVFTFISHSIKSIVTLITGLLLARMMGPDEFGFMAFLIATFVAFRGITDLGSSSAFYTFISSGSVGYSIIRRYFYWLALQLILPFLVIFFAFPKDWIVFIWQEENRFLILLAFCAVFSQHSIWATIAQIGDSQRKTYLIQTAALFISLCHLLAVIMLWKLDFIGIISVLIATFIEHILIMGKLTQE